MIISRSGRARTIVSGRHFAMLEMKIILAMIFRRYRLSLASGTPVNRAMRVSLVPSHGMPMTVADARRKVVAPPVRGSIRQSVGLR
jgi:hypothetical protein